MTIIDLLPCISPSPNHISLSEYHAIEEYAQEALLQGYICPSTSPFLALVVKGGESGNV